MNSSQIAHEFCNIIREIRKKYVGKGPEKIVIRFVGPWAVCEMKGNLTNVEKFISKSVEGKRMIHEARTSLVKELYKDDSLIKALENIVQAKFITLYTDFNFDLDSAMTVFVFDRDLKLDSHN
jgi:uncharacterized protein YbcI